MSLLDVEGQRLRSHLDLGLL